MKDYVAVFNKIKEDHPDTFLLYGDYLLVNILKDEEIKTKTGLVLSTPDNHRQNSLNTNKPVFCQILVVGQGYSNNEGVVEPLGADPGEIVVVGQNSPLIFSRFGNIPNVEGLQLALIRESEIIMQFPGKQEYDTYFSELQKGLNGI